ncbi:hypothetical protein V5E97_26515 [Singulisphaera sp. Ch08]|uniref:Transposase DDE domain-containing protein n=1 Tax=Singulisphaera sp. Ch08 TaxID=3120278 RepID=A0AAU7CA95_9BACT
MTSFPTARIRAPTPGESAVRIPVDPPDHLILDFDATNDRIHGHQEGRFFHGD